MRLNLPLLLSFVPLTGCTAIILNDAATAGAPCEGVDDCPGGTRCEDEQCVVDDREPVAPPAPTRVGADGGIVPGPDGVVLEVPQDALDDDTNITITRASSTTLLPAGLVSRSRFYLVVPDLVLDAAATITLPLDDECPDCAIYRAEADDFVPLPVVERTDDIIAATSATLGLFVAAEAGEEP